MAQPLVRYPADVIVLEETVYTRRNPQRLNCLQAPLVPVPGTSYLQHLTNMLQFFEIIFTSVVSDAIAEAAPFYADEFGATNSATEHIGRTLYALHGWFIILHDLLIARHIQKLRVQRANSKPKWTVINNDNVNTEFGKIVFNAFYVLESCGWSPLLPLASHPRWQRLRAVQAGRNNLLPHLQSYRHLITPGGKSLAEACVFDNTIPQMTPRLCNASQLGSVVRTDSTLESPFAYKGKQIFTRTYQFFNEDGEEIDPADGRVVPHVPRFDFEAPLYVTSDEEESSK